MYISEQELKDAICAAWKDGRDWDTATIYDDGTIDSFADAVIEHIKTYGDHAGLGRGELSMVNGEYVVVYRPNSDEAKEAALLESEAAR